MSKDIARMPMQDRFQHLHSVISGQRFLNKQGLGNEVPFFICPYRAEEAVEMERLQSQLINRLEQTGIKILNINLYDLSVELLKERDVWSQVVELEPTVFKRSAQGAASGCFGSRDASCAGHCGEATNC